MSIETKEAVEILCKALREDHELYYAYQANIAMAFKNEFNRNFEDESIYISTEKLHKISNQAAKNFLNLLIIE